MVHKESEYDALPILKVKTSAYYGQAISLYKTSAFKVIGNPTREIFLVFLGVFMFPVCFARWLIAEREHKALCEI